MNKIKKQEIQKTLNTEIGRVRESAKITDEASKSVLMNKLSSADKDRSEAAVELANNYLDRLELLKKEFAKTPEKTPEFVENGSLVEVVYDDGEVAELVLVKNAVSLPGLSFISVDSPLGKAVLGKSEGDNFSYDLENGKKYSGKISLLK